MLWCPLYRSQCNLNHGWWISCTGLTKAPALTFAINIVTMRALVLKRELFKVCAGIFILIACFLTNSGEKLGAFSLRKDFQLCRRIFATSWSTAKRKERVGRNSYRLQLLCHWSLKWVSKQKDANSWLAIAFPLVKLVRRFFLGPPVFNLPSQLFISFVCVDSCN